MKSVTIAGLEVHRIEYRGQSVVTFTMIDHVHNRVDGTAGRTFRENRDRFEKGDDFLELDQPDEIRRLGFSRPQGGTPALVILITRRGYLKITKSLNDDKAWFVLADVCRVLEIGNPSDAASRLDDDEKGVATIETLGGRQQFRIINESGLYSLILTSRKAEAKCFKEWVTGSVLTAIQKDSGYLINRTVGIHLAVENVTPGETTPCDNQTSVARYLTSNPGKRWLQPSLPLCGCRQWLRNDI